MKKQSLKDRMDEHLGAAHRGKKKQTMKSRRHESEGMEHEMHHEPRHAIKSRVKTKHAARMAGVEKLKHPGGRVHHVKMKKK